MKIMLQTGKHLYSVDLSRGCSKSRIIFLNQNIIRMLIPNINTPSQFLN